jgi:hypothetical protein
VGEVVTFLKKHHAGTIKKCADVDKGVARMLLSGAMGKRGLHSQMLTDLYGDWEGVRGAAVDRLLLLRVCAAFLQAHVPGEQAAAAAAT